MKIRKYEIHLKPDSQSFGLTIIKTGVNLPSAIRKVLIQECKRFNSIEKIEVVDS